MRRGFDGRMQPTIHLEGFEQRLDPWPCIEKDSQVSLWSGQGDRSLEVRKCGDSIAASILGQREEHQDRQEVADPSAGRCLHRHAPTAGWHR